MNPDIALLSLAYTHGIDAGLDAVIEKAVKHRLPKRYRKLPGTASGLAAKAPSLILQGRGGKLANSMPHAGRSRNYLAKAGHDVSAQPRAANGEWTAGNGAAPGVHDSHRSAVGAAVSHIKEVLRNAGAASYRSAAAYLRQAGGDIGNSIKSFRPTGANPIAGGGVQVTGQHDVHRYGQKTGTFQTTVQLHRNATPAYNFALDNVHRALVASGHPTVSRRSNTVTGKFTPKKQTVAKNASAWSPRVGVLTGQHYG